MELRPLARLCLSSREACFVMSSMVFSFYASLSGETSKLKHDKSVFTIADGIVQNLLVNHLFVNKFRDIVGEEDTYVNIINKPYVVDDLVVPEPFYDLIDRTRTEIESISSRIDNDAYRNLTVFIDPIDGTREFSTGLGEQCSICIGFSDLGGLPVAGVVFRPIPQPIASTSTKASECTWAIGAASESFAESNLDSLEQPFRRGFLTSNGGVSPFLMKVMEGLDCERVPSGGAGNKMLMLLEGKGAYYIQDRGVSRWDTCAAQAVLEAHGGVLAKLSSFATRKSLDSYTYLKSPLNLDFEPSIAQLTPYNAANSNHVHKGDNSLATTAESLKPYANVCGLLALNREGALETDRIHESIQQAHLTFPAEYN